MYLKNYTRKLPHIQSETADYLVTYRLFDSIPGSVLNKIRKEEADYVATSTKPISASELNRKKFFAFDSFLDKAANGPYWLQNPAIAKEVYDSLLYLNGVKINLNCFTIMSNHVHTLFSIRNPSDNLFKIMQSHKSFTAKKCNKILAHTGKFWEEESFDHIVRSGKLATVKNYILQNPVKAGLVKNWEEWPWTYLA